MNYIGMKKIKNIIKIIDYVKNDEDGVFDFELFHLNEKK
jgi:hypothetical protein